MGRGACFRSRARQAKRSCRRRLTRESEQVSSIALAIGVAAADTDDDGLASSISSSLSDLQRARGFEEEGALISSARRASIQFRDQCRESPDGRTKNELFLPSRPRFFPCCLHLFLASAAWKNESGMKR